MDFSRLPDRKVLIAAGAGAVALIVVVGVVLAVRMRQRAAPPVLSGSEEASLQVEMGSSTGPLDLTRPLRCFVGGRDVGLLTLKDCAKRNGVDPAQMDVGLASSGVVAAAASSAEPLAPLAGSSAVGAETSASAADVCWRFAGDWRKVGEAMSLDACIQTLFGGRCAQPGSAEYGRWNDTSIRLVAGGVERQGSDGRYHLLVQQDPDDCLIPPVGE